MAFKSINPATGRQIATYEEADPGEVERLLTESNECFHSWRLTSYAERASLLTRVAGVLRERGADLAELMTREMGKLIGQSEAEVEKCAWVCEHYASHAPADLQDLPVETEAQESYVSFQPLGPVLAVMPWNFPFWQVFRFAAPALMAGNTAILKHASNVQGCARSIAGVFEQAGAPEGLFSVLAVSGADVPAIIADPRVAAVTLTGSTPAGRSVGAAAGRALKKSVLELGGSDPYLVLADADLKQAAAACVTSRMINSGQSCIAAKRFIVEEPVREEFTALVLKEMRAYAPGDPTDPATTLAPMARHDLRDELHGQVVRSVKAGAVLLAGGEVPDGSGAFYPATVLAGVRPGNPALAEELFGPVAAIVSAADERQAVALANQSVFGLGAAVFTRDLEKGARIATKELLAGSCVVNGFVKSDPRMPFGGIKESGYGRELSTFGIREFVNVKSVVMNPEANSGITPER